MPSNAHGSISIAATMNTDSSLWTPIANHTKNMSIANKQGYKPLNPADALVYLELVKKTYADKPAVYQNLIEIMKDFKNKRTDIVKVIETITVLFKDYPFLIIGFNPFLPPGYRVECNQTENGLVVQTSLPMGQTKTTTILPTDTANSLQQKHQKQPMSLQDAFAYTTKLKERFGEDSDTYRSFVGILRKFQKKQVSTEQVYWSICKLFKDSEDLFKLFIEFLPPLESTTEPRCTSDQHKKRAEESLDDLPQPKRSKHDHPSQPPISDLRSTSPTPQNVLANDEERFFERARKHIGNKTTFNAFLKVINLFNQQIIDENLAAHRAEAFLGGNPSLFQSFKALLNYNEPDHSLLYAYAQAASPEDKKYECGPSYRAASLSWRKQQCSGRDPLCWEVLNTDYVSHPTWASEDSGFTASKKNQYEEALHVIEEARYAYDMDIQANTTTVDHLKKVTETLSTMTEKKQKAYRLPPDFGGPSPSIYSCAIKKVYGNEKGQDMIKLLQTDPAQTIPGVLKRLVHTGEVLQKGKQRQTELWKEAEIKNYYRALDHQGINFKKKDKKANSVKRLVSEIEALRLEQATKQQREPTDGYNDLPDPQYTFIFEDQAVLKDVIHILLFVLERNLLYGAKDCNRIRGFLSLFLPTLFDIDLFNEDTQSHQKATENTRQSEIEGETRTGRGGRAGKTEITGRAERACRGKRGEMGKMGEKGEREETHHLTTTFVSDPTQSRRPSFFGNSGFYCFVRLFQMVYTRLLDIKALDLEYKRNVNQAKYATTAEFDVGLKTREMENIKLDFTSDHYTLLLDLIEKLLTGEIEQHVFEGSARYIFGTRAHPVFTIDKLLISMIRQIYPLVNDERVEKLLGLFQNYAKLAYPVHEKLSYFRMKVEKIMGVNEDLYCAIYNPKERALSLQLLRRSSSVYQDDGDDEYEEYCASYMDWRHLSEGIKEGQLMPCYLERNRKQGLQDCDMENMYTFSGMKYKMCRNTYHLFYLIGSEDVFQRHVCYKDLGSYSLAPLENRVSQGIEIPLKEVEARVRKLLG